MSYAIEFADEQLDLLPERAVWWPARRTLLVADLHLGKPASFRSAGAPVPEQVTGADLARLSSLIKTQHAQRVIVLGDLA
ncbi:MAG: DEAD/DEAH box helicase, partial [Phycisphaerales bacterium]|nr:DEAD/DEAH box helicase [Phycisphaerales bacterium]